MRQLIIDTETTGLEPNQGHRIIEIGCVEIVNRTITGNELHMYINPGRESDPQALAIHGLTSDFLAGKPWFSDIVNNVLDFISDAELVAHNAAFEVKFFNSELERLGKDTITNFCSSVTDSLQYARTLHPGKRNSLDALCERYGVCNRQRSLHGALLDAQLLAQVWLAMTRGQEELLIEPEKSPSFPVADCSTKANITSKVIYANAQELQEHIAIMHSLKKISGKKCIL